MSTAKVERRTVPADLVEATPENRGLGYWLLAAPLLVFVLWGWVDLFAYYSPLPWYWIDLMIAVVIFALFIVLPLGWLAHRLITSAPRIFQNAGWDVRPLEPIDKQEQYLVRFAYKQRHRAANTWQRAWLRAAQGWVYIEIAAILVGGVLMVPLFFSALDFGFGR